MIESNSKIRNSYLNETIVIILASVSGLMLAFFYTLLFIINDKGWIRNLLNTGLMIIMFNNAMIFKKHFPNFFDGDLLFLLFVIFFFLSTTMLTFVFIKLLYKHHNKSNPSSKVGFAQFLSAPNKILNGSFFPNDNSENLKEYKTSIEKQKEELANNIKNNQINSIKIPIDHNLTNIQYYEKFKSFIDITSKYLCYIDKEAETFLKQNGESNNNNDDDNEDTFKNYLYILSLATGQFLFDCQKYDIRIHFRILHKDSNTFEKFVMFGRNQLISKDSLTIMSANSGILNAAIESKSSLVKSANLNLHKKGENDHQWKDYITMVFSNIKDENHNSFLSMTISIHDKELYSDLLYFLSYMEIERYIERNLIKIYSKYNINSK